MMKTKLSHSMFYLPVGVMTTFLIVLACGDLKDSGDVKLYFTPDMIGIKSEYLKKSDLTSLQSLGRFLHVETILSLNKSSQLEKITCVGLNVMGPNISSANLNEGSSAWNNFGDSLISGGKCGYAGVVSQIYPVTTSAMIKVAVPYGNSRVIQLVGYKGLDCSKKLNANDLASEKSVPAVYEIGRA